MQAEITAAAAVFKLNRPGERRESVVTAGLLQWPQADVLTPRAGEIQPGTIDLLVFPLLTGRFR